jgi:hypothetical protein
MGWPTLSSTLPGMRPAVDLAFELDLVSIGMPAWPVGGIWGFRRRAAVIAPRWIAHWRQPTAW